MKRLLASVLIFISINVFKPIDAEAEVLGDFTTNSYAYSWRDQVFEKLDIKFAYKSSPPNVHWYIDTSDAGKTLRLTSGSDGFEAMRDMLSNGMDNELVLSVLGPSGTGSAAVFYESAMDHYAGSWPDFAGTDIWAISLTVNSLVWEYPVALSHNPSGDKKWNYINYDLTVSIESVPEPATMLLLGLGGLVLRRRKCTL